MTPLGQHAVSGQYAHHVACAIEKRFSGIGVDLRLDYTHTEQDPRRFATRWVMAFRPRGRLRLKHYTANDLIVWTQSGAPELRVVMNVPNKWRDDEDMGRSLEKALASVDGIVISATLKRAATDVARGTTVVLEV